MSFLNSVRTAIEILPKAFLCSSIDYADTVRSRIEYYHACRRDTAEYSIESIQSPRSLGAYSDRIGHILAVSSTAAIIGATMVAIYRTLMASHGNGALWPFWISAGAYAGLAAEAVLGILQMLQDSIERRVRMNALTRPT